MNTILCLIAGLLIFICCWFAAYIYDEDVTECSGAIDYVPASVDRQLETELIKMTTRAEKAEAELAVSESERMEQARLLGKGGSREAALLAELAAMKARAEKAEADVERRRNFWN